MKAWKVTFEDGSSLITTHKPDSCLSEMVNAPRIHEGWFLTTTTLAKDTRHIRRSAAFEILDMLKKMPFHPEPWEEFHKAPIFKDGKFIGEWEARNCLCDVCEIRREIGKRFVV